MQSEAVVAEARAHGEAHAAPEGDGARCSPEVGIEDARWLGRLGSTWRLVLVDLWRDEVVDLADTTAIERYLAE